MGCTIRQAEAESLYFPPSVALHLVKMACERPDKLGRSLSQWDCVATTGARWHRREHLGRHGSSDFEQPPAQTVASPFVALAQGEMVLCVDEKTSLQPRKRKSPTRPAQPGRPVQVEHEYDRDGALNLFAAFDTRTGKAYGYTAQRKRQKEFIEFLEKLDGEIPAEITAIHIVLDNLRMHKGKQVQAWLAKHPRFVFHHPPVHCSWMNQVEQWFSILQRKRLAIADFADKAELAERLQAYIREWNEIAHPFKWRSCRQGIYTAVRRRRERVPPACTSGS
jgi:transposase